MTADRGEPPGEHLGEQELTYEAAEATLRSLAALGAFGSPPPGEEKPSTESQQVETRLRLAEARYRTLVEQMPVVTFLAALDGGVNELYVSPQIEQMLGFTAEEWLSNPILWYTQLHPEDRERWHTEFARTCAAGERFRSEYRFLARDG